MGGGTYSILGNAVAKYLPFQHLGSEINSPSLHLGLAIASKRVTAVNQERCRS